MRTILPTALVVILAAGVLVSQRAGTPSATVEDESIADKLQRIVSQSLEAEVIQTADLQWQDLRAQGTPMQIVSFVNENPTSPHREDALAYLQDLLVNEHVTRTAPDLLTVTPATEGF